MSNIGLDLKVTPDSSLRLFKDAGYALPIDLVQLLVAGQTVYSITEFPTSRIFGVYELVDNSWRARLDYKVSSSQIKFTSPTANKILVVSKRYFNYLQLIPGLGKPVKLYIKGAAGFEYADVQIASILLSTGLLGTIEFSLKESGPWVTSLSLSIIPNSFFVRARANKQGSFFDTAIQISAMTFLGDDDVA